jgi:hypothetical protein
MVGVTVAQPAYTAFFGNLSGALAQCGRGPATGVGNPVDSVVVADFRAGFRQHALAEGARRAVQLGAVPFAVERVRELVRGIRARAMDVLRLHPDGASFEVGPSWGPEVVGRAAVPLLRC